MRAEASRSARRTNVNRTMASTTPATGKTMRGDTPPHVANAPARTAIPSTTTEFGTRYAARTGPAAKIRDIVRMSFTPLTMSPV